MIVAALSDARSFVRFPPKQIVFAQGDAAGSVLFVRKGKVALTVVSGEGKQAVVAIEGSGEFLGEGCLIGQTRRRASAIALTQCEIVEIGKDEMLRAVDRFPSFARMFVSHVLTKNARFEEELINYHFNSTEKRLARALLLLADVGPDGSQGSTERISQEMLAEMIGATRSRVSYFMNRFRQCGYIDYNGQRLCVHDSLAQAMLGEGPLHRPSCEARTALVQAVDSLARTGVPPAQFARPVSGALWSRAERKSINR